MAEHDGDKPCKNDACRHDLGTDSLHGTVHDGIFQIDRIFQLPFFYPFLIGQVKIEEHNHACLRIEPRKGDDTDPYGDTHIVI